MIFFQDCQLQINDKLYNDFCLQQETQSLKIYDQNIKACLKLTDFSFKQQKSTDSIWTFLCKKCKAQVCFVHSDNCDQEQKKQNLQKLTDHGIELNSEEQQSTNTTAFNLNQTENQSLFFIFEGSQNQSNTNSTVLKKKMKAFSSLRYHPEEELIKDKDNSNSYENFETQPMLNQSIDFQDKKFAQKDLEYNQDFSTNNLITPQRKQFKKRNTLTKLMNLFKKGQSSPSQVIPNQDYPESIRRISKYFDIPEKPVARRVSVCRNFENLLSSKIDFSQKIDLNSQKNLSIKFITESSQNKKIFSSEKYYLQNNNKFSKNENSEEVKIQDITIQAILKYNQIIGLKAIQDYSKKTMNELFQDYNSQNKVRGFCFNKDMLYLFQQYSQWTFSKDINIEMFKKIWFLYREAIETLKNLILHYFSFKNKNLIINKFYVFSIKIFTEEINNLVEGFVFLTKNFVNLTDQEILVNAQIDYDILEFIFKECKMQYNEEELNQNFELIENKIYEAKVYIFQGLLFIKENLKNLLSEL